MHRDHIAFFIVKSLVDTDCLTVLFALIELWVLETEDVILHALSIVCVYVCMYVFFFYYFGHAPLRWVILHAEVHTIHFGLFSIGYGSHFVCQLNAYS